MSVYIEKAARPTTDFFEGNAVFMCAGTKYGEIVSVAVGRSEYAWQNKVK